MNTPFVVSVSDRYLWSLKPFSYLFLKYVGNDVKIDVAGYSLPTFELPHNFKFFSIASPQYPQEKWADGFLKFLYQYNEDHFVLLLEDYWLCRNIDKAGIDSLKNFMVVNSDIMRIDLVSDRLGAGGMHDVGYWDRFDIVEAPQSMYQVSLQASIWNRKHFMDVLDSLPPDCRSAWDVELVGTSEANAHNKIVYGTRQFLMRYINGMGRGGDNINYNGFTPEDADSVRDLIRTVKPE